jgi:anthranilate phosphoribosyltransferase
MKNSFSLLSSGQKLTEPEAYQLFSGICNSTYNPTQVAAIMTIYIMRPVTVIELSGFRKALLDVCIPVKLDKKAMDVCGTGGDEKNTFNISTLSAIVLAASGIPIAKHGNYGSSSISGSSDILNFFGHKFKDNSDDLNRDLNEHNLCFIHAPFFHPALKNVAQQRKELGTRTFFNMLGPLVNPANISFRFIGVYNLEIARIYNYILQKDTSDFCLVHSLDGYDEISLTSPFRQITKTSETTFFPESLGFKLLTPQSIYGGLSLQENARIFKNVLENVSTPAQKNVVISNSAVAMHNFDPSIPLATCIAICTETIDSKRANILFKKITKN